MNMFARFDENAAMTLQDIKETKRYGRTDGRHENSTPTTNKVCGGYKNKVCGGYNEWFEIRNFTLNEKDNTC